MRYPKNQRAETRTRVLSAAGRAFRTHGQGGVGVDGIASEAGVTSGAFYTHFGSKDEAFEAAVVEGLEELLAGVQRFRAEHGPAWLGRLAAWYLGASHRKDLACGCALVTLSPDVMRSGEQVRANYGRVFARIVDEIAEGLARGEGDDIEPRRARARSILALFAGAVMLSRSMSDEAAAEAISQAALASVRTIATPS